MKAYCLPTVSTVRSHLSQSLVINTSLNTVYCLTRRRILRADRPQILCKSPPGIETPSVWGTISRSVTDRRYHYQSCSYEYHCKIRNRKDNIERTKLTGRSSCPTRCSFSRWNEDLAFSTIASPKPRGRMNRGH